MSVEIHTDHSIDRYSHLLPEVPKTIDVSGTPTEISSLSFSSTQELLIGLETNRTPGSDEEKLYVALLDQRNKLAREALAAGVFDKLDNVTLPGLYTQTVDASNAHTEFGIVTAENKRQLAVEVAKAKAVDVDEPTEERFRGICEFERARMVAVAETKLAEVTSADDVSFRRAGETSHDLEVKTGNDDLRAVLVEDLQKRKEALAVEFMASDAPEAKAVTKKIDEVHLAVAEVSEHFDALGVVSTKEKGQLLQAIATPPPETQDETYAGVCEHVYRQRVEESGLQAFVEEGITSVAEASLSYHRAGEAVRRIENPDPGSAAKVAAVEQAVRDEVVGEVKGRREELIAEAKAKHLLDGVDRAINSEEADLNSQMALAHQVLPTITPALPEATRVRLVADLRRNQAGFKVGEGVPELYQGIHEDYYRGEIDRMVQVVETTPVLAETASYLQVREAVLKAETIGEQGETERRVAHPDGQPVINRQAEIRAEQKVKLAEEAEEELERRRGVLIREALDRHMLDGIVDNDDRTARIDEVVELRRRCNGFGVPKEAADDLKRRLSTMADHPPVSAVPIDVMHQGIREDLWREGSGGLGRNLPPELTNRRGVAHLADNLPLAAGDPADPASQTYEAYRMRWEAARIALRRQKIDLASNHDDQVQAEIQRARGRGQTINEAQAIENLTRNYVEQQAVTELNGLVRTFEDPLRGEFERKYGARLDTFADLLVGGNVAGPDQRDLRELNIELTITDEDRRNLSPDALQRKMIYRGLFLNRLEEMGLTVVSARGRDQIVGILNRGGDLTGKLAFDQAYREGTAEQARQEASRTAEEERVRHEAQRTADETAERERKAQEVRWDLTNFPEDAAGQRVYMRRLLVEMETTESFYNVAFLTYDARVSDLEGKIGKLLSEGQIDPEVARETKLRIALWDTSRSIESGQGYIKRGKDDKGNTIQDCANAAESRGHVVSREMIRFFLGGGAGGIDVAKAWDLLQDANFNYRDLLGKVYEGRPEAERTRLMSGVEVSMDDQPELGKTAATFYTDGDPDRVEDVRRYLIRQMGGEVREAEAAFRIAAELATATLENSVWNPSVSSNDQLAECMRLKEQRFSWARPESNRRNKVGPQCTLGLIDGFGVSAIRKWAGVGIGERLTAQKILEEQTLRKIEGASWVSYCRITLSRYNQVKDELLRKDFDPKMINPDYLSSLIPAFNEVDPYSLPLDDRESIMREWMVRAETRIRTLRASGQYGATQMARIENDCRAHYQKLGEADIAQQEKEASLTAKYGERGLRFYHVMGMLDVIRSRRKDLGITDAAVERMINYITRTPLIAKVGEGGENRDTGTYLTQDDFDFMDRRVIHFWQTWAISSATETATEQAVAAILKFPIIGAKKK